MSNDPMLAEAIAYGYGRKPKIKSNADLGKLLYLLSYMSSRRKSVESETEAQINALRKQQADALSLDVDGEPVGYDQHERALTEAIETYVLKHRDKVFDGQTKTVAFPAGTIALKDKPPWLQFQEGVTKKSIVAEAIEENGLLPKILNWLKRLGLRPWLKLVPDLDTTAITQAAKSGEITADELAEWGVSFEGAETVVIKPADYSAATA